MSRPRVWLFIVGIVLTLGLVVWLLDSVNRLYVSIAFTSPFLANLLLLLIVVLLVALAGAIAYYGYLFLRPPSRPSRPIPQVPVEKTAAAEETLRAVRQQVEQIQDEVARQALFEQSRQIEENLAKREIHVVVFGTGSAGKTSIVNAILGRIVGQVGAPMGTTEVGET